MYTLDIGEIYKMKKFLTAFISLVICFAMSLYFAACKDDNSGNASGTDGGNSDGDNTGGNGGTTPEISAVLTKEEWKSAFDGCGNYIYQTDSFEAKVIVKIDGGIIYVYNEVYPNPAYTTPEPTKQITYYAGDGVYYNFIYSPTEALKGQWVRQTFTETTAVDGHIIGPTMISQYESQLSALKLTMDIFADAYDSFNANAQTGAYCCAQLTTPIETYYGETNQTLRNINVRFDGKSIANITFTVDKIDFGALHMGDGYVPAATCSYSDFGKVEIDLPTEFVEWSGLLGDIVAP